MKRAIAVVVAVCALALLSGCGLIGPTTPVAPFEAEFTVAVVPPLTVAVDARATRGATAYTWDWGDGSPAQTGGAAAQVARHTYARPGRYVVILTVEGDPAAGGGGGGGDGGPGPGPIGPIMGAPGVAASYRIVDLLQTDLPTPVILALSFWGNEPAKVFFPWAQVHFYAGASGGTNLWYQWEIVRVDPATGDPIPYPWEREVKYLRSEQETFTTFVPGPGGCPSHGKVWTLRVRLWATDEYGRRAMAETRIQTTWGQ